MKRAHFIQSMLTLTGTAFIYGCKDFADGTEEPLPNSYASPTIDGAQQWFTDNYLASLASAKTQKTSVNRKLGWEKSKKIKDGKHDFVWVPIQYEGDQLGTALLMWREGEEYVQRLAKYLCWSISEGFVAYRKPNGDYDGFIAQMAFDPTMTDLSNPKYMETFSGLIINADLNENILRTWRFLEGKMVSYTNPASNNSKEKEKGARTNCYTYYTQYTTVTGQSCGPNCTEVFYTLHTVPHEAGCGGSTTGSDPGYMGSGSNTNGDWYGYQNGGGGSSTPTAQIKNQLQYPCFKNVFNNLLSASFNNKVQQILLNFNKSSTLTFTIKEEWMSSTSVNATTVGNVITLNLNALGNASQEFVAKVIYHEVLHVFIGSTAAIDHQTMATKYVTPMAQALMAWFPINLSDATGLAWSGLQNTNAYNSLSQADQYNAYIKSKNYKNVNNEYNHQYGHSCP
jgi:hypothetical protein